MNGETTKVVILHVNDVLPNRFQPRIKFDEAKINELADSIKKYGIIQPITVRRIGDKYEIIAGERRYKATVLAGLSEIPAIINNLNDKDSSEVALIENVQREDLTPIEEAISYKKILDLGDLTQEELAEKLGMGQSTVANKLRLLQLPDAVQEALLENKISERHARSLLRIHDIKKQVEMLQRIIKERLTVRRTDDEIKIMLEGKAIVKTEKSIEIKEEAKKPTILETEILELGSLLVKNEKKEGEELEMNTNDPINQFDIPEINIINDETSKSKEVEMGEIQAVPNQPMTPQEIKIEEPVTPKMENSTNPGFMDIDKIEREATDIQPKQKPVEENAFLLDTPIPSDPKPVLETKPTAPIGRFFDVLPSMQKTEDIDTKKETKEMEGSIFSDDSSIFSNIEPPVEPQVVTPARVIAPVLPTDNIWTDPILEPITNTPTPTPTPIVEPRTEESNFSSPIGQPILPKTVELSSPLDKVVEPVIKPVIPIIEEAVPTSIIEPVPNANPFEAPIIPLVPPTMRDSIEEAVKPVTLDSQTSASSINPLSFRTREGMNAVRGVGHQLESMGLKVDIEEMDLPGNYQIIIKIEK